MAAVESLYECVGGPLDGENHSYPKAIKKKLANGRYELDKFTSKRTKVAEKVLKWIPNE